MTSALPVSRDASAQFDSAEKHSHSQDKENRGNTAGEIHYADKDCSDIIAIKRKKMSKRHSAAENFELFTIFFPFENVKQPDKLSGNNSAATFNQPPTKSVIITRPKEHRCV